MIQLPLVSVVIACRNEEKHIANSINSILNQDYPENLIEIIVVDGMSDDSSGVIISEKAKQHKNIILLQNKEQITPVAFNMGIRSAKGEFVQILSARQILCETYISTCVNLFLNDKKTGCIGGTSKFTYDSNEGKYIALAYQSWFGHGVGSVFSTKRSTYTDTAVAPIYRKNLLLEVGVFDETFIRNQDDELSFRIIKNRYKIFTTSETFSCYLVRSSLGSLFKQHYQYGYWKVYVNIKHRTFTTYRQIFPCLFVCFLVLGFPILNILGMSYLFIGVLGIYIMLGFLFNRGKNIIEKSRVFLIIFIMHLSYGIGYLEGILHFLILEMEPLERNKTLSR